METRKGPYDKMLERERGREREKEKKARGRRGGQTTRRKREKPMGDY